MNKLKRIKHRIVFKVLEYIYGTIKVKVDIIPGNTDMLTVIRGRKLRNILELYNLCFAYRLHIMYRIYPLQDWSTIPTYQVDPDMKLYMDEVHMQIRASNPKGR